MQVWELGHKMVLGLELGTVHRLVLGPGQEPEHMLVLEQVCNWSFVA